MNTNLIENMNVIMGIYGEEEMYTTQKTTINSITDLVFVSQSEDTSEYDKLIRHTTMAMQKFANSYLKSVAGLEARDVEQIKDALKNFVCKGERAKEIKNEIIEDLTGFQKSINQNHVQNLADTMKQKQLCEKAIKMLDSEKHKLIAQRLSKIVWPYDAKTKEYDNKIESLKVRIHQLEQKIEATEQSRPMASQKDILLYEMKLKEKYLKAA